MSLIPNLKSIFKENLVAATSNCLHGKAHNLCPQCIKEKHGGEAFGKTLQDIATHHKVDIKELEKQLVKGIAIEGEHGSDKANARKVAMDHLWENPKYYTKLIGAGLEEPIEENVMGAGVPAAAPMQPQQPQQPQNNKQEPQQDPKKMEEYQKKMQELDKKIQSYIAEQQKLTTQKNVLDKKIQALNLKQQRTSQEKSKLGEKYGINQPS